MHRASLHALIRLVTPLSLAACASPGASGDSAYGSLTGVLAAEAPVVFVPVGSDDDGCTMYTKELLREGILVDTGIWYRTADDHFVLDPSRCVAD